MNFHGMKHMCEPVERWSIKNALEFHEKITIIRRKRKRMLSRDCDGCSQRKPCSKRFDIAEKGEKVYCPDGTVHLVDACKPTI
jgi:hypothetical protein